MVTNVENFALEQLKQMYDGCLYLLTNAYACNLEQCNQDGCLLVDWEQEHNKKAWKELQRLECGFKECEEPIGITRGKYIALFEGEWNTRLYDEIEQNLYGLTKEQAQHYIGKLTTLFDDCKMPLKGFYEWVNELEIFKVGVLCDEEENEGEESKEEQRERDYEVLRMWERLNYCIGQFKANVKEIAKKQGIIIHTKEKADFRSYIIAEDKEETLKILHKAIDPLMQSTERKTKKAAIGYIRAAIAMEWLKRGFTKDNFCKEFGNMGRQYYKYMEIAILDNPYTDNWGSHYYNLKAIAEELIEFKTE